MMGLYDAELSMTLGRQRGVELRAAAAHHRLARTFLGAGPARAPWWRSGRSTRGGPDGPGDPIS